MSVSNLQVRGMPDMNHEDYKHVKDVQLLSELWYGVFGLSLLMSIVQHKSYVLFGHLDSIYEFASVINKWLFTIIVTFLIKLFIILPRYFCHNDRWCFFHGNARVI